MNYSVPAGWNDPNPDRVYAAVMVPATKEEYDAYIASRGSNFRGKTMNPDYEILLGADDPTGYYAGIPTSPVASSIGFVTDPLATLASGAPEIQDVARDNPGTSLTDLIGKALSLYQMDRQQRAFLETNRELIAQGRQPLAWDQFQPTASVGVRVDSNTQKLLWALGLGALAIAALAVLRRG